MAPMNPALFNGWNISLDNHLTLPARPAVARKQEPMQGLMFNMLAELSHATEWEDEIWELVLACADSLKPAPGFEDSVPDVLRLPDLEAATGALFKCLLESALPFCEEEWDEPSIDLGLRLLKGGDGSSD